VDKAIRLCLKRRDHVASSASSSLTPQDHFYRQISEIDGVFEGLRGAQEEAEGDEGEDAMAAIMAVNKIFAVILRDALQTRQRKQEDAEAQKKRQKGKQKHLDNCEYLPWTAAPGGVRAALIAQVRLIDR